MPGTPAAPCPQVSPGVPWGPWCPPSCPSPPCSGCAVGCGGVAPVRRVQTRRAGCGRWTQLQSNPPRSQRRRHVAPSRVEVMGVSVVAASLGYPHPDTAPHLVGTLGEPYCCRPPHPSLKSSPGRGGLSLWSVSPPSAVGGCCSARPAWALRTQAAWRGLQQPATTHYRQRRSVPSGPGPGGGKRTG